MIEMDYIIFMIGSVCGITSLIILFGIVAKRLRKLTTMVNRLNKESVGR